MKRIICIIMSICILTTVSVFAADSEAPPVCAAPGDGVWEPSSADHMEVSEPCELSQELTDLINEKENSLLMRSRASYPVNVRLSAMPQFPQEKSYYCGCSAVKSILANKGVSKSQAFLAGSSYLKTEYYGNTPWYITNGSSTSDYPVIVTLNNLQSFHYAPYPSGSLGTAPSQTELKNKIMFTTSQGYGVAACGKSKSVASDLSHLPNYPAKDIGHWLSVDGYNNSGSEIWVIDPVANSPAISWSGNINPYYTRSLSRFTAFVSSRGIIW